MKYFLFVITLCFLNCANHNTNKDIDKINLKESQRVIVENSIPQKIEYKKEFSKNMKIETIIVGGGCFWCVESVYRALKGITNVESGYSGGEKENATYQQVSTGTTKHAEVVKIEFNPDVISLEEVLLVFMATHTPTTLNRQGNDIGTQYRSVIFYTNENQKEVSEKLISELQPHYEDKIVTEISPLLSYFEAEDYHQNYFAKNPNQAYCNAVIPPKIDKLKKLFADKMK